MSSVGQQYASIEREPPVGGMPGSWEVSFHGGEVTWRDFFTGPLKLSDAELADITQQLLGMTWDEVPAAAARELTPYSSSGVPVPALILHSATSVLRSLEADLIDTADGRCAEDVTTYVEARSVCLARPGDLCVGRTLAWQHQVEMAGVESVTIPGLAYYYLSHAILRLAADTDGQAEPLRRIVAWLRAREEPLVCPYALDREYQVVLLYLKRLAHLDRLLMDANSPVINDVWNFKAPLYPRVDSAAGITAVNGDPFETLAAETALSPLSVQLGVEYVRVPGYTVVPDPDNPEVTAARLRHAARLLSSRYGLSRACLKPSGGSAGSRITTGVVLDGDLRWPRLAEQVHIAGTEYVLEADFDYAVTDIAGVPLQVMPSAHVRHGHVPDGVTLQIVDGTAWHGNIYLDAAAAPAAGLTAAEYQAMLDTTESLRAAFEAVGHHLVTGGFDFAVGTVGGVFADHRFVAVQDPNLSSHGAEYLRLFLEQVLTAGLGPYAVTKVVRPHFAGTLAALRTAPPPPDSDFTTVISSVPGRWGMLAASGRSPGHALTTVLDYERQLLAGGLLVPIVPR